MTSLQVAYQAGVKLAMQEAGLLKEAGLLDGDQGGSVAWPALLGPIGGAIAAPEGKGWAGASGAWGGGLLGVAGGALGGGALGAGIGALAKNPHLGALIGGGLGAAGGQMYGAAKGYRAATGTHG